MEPIKIVQYSACFGIGWIMFRICITIGENLCDMLNKKLKE